MAHRVRWHLSLLARRRLSHLVVSGLGIGVAFTGFEQGISRTEPEGPAVAVSAAASSLVRETIEATYDLLNPEFSMMLSATATEPEWDLPNLDHPRVDYWVERFTTDKRGEFEIFLERKGRYAPMIREKLRENNMPQDLIFLAMIESGFHPKAYSPAHASGIWQFIAPTGQRYGLDINRAVDERNDPEKATDAALRYLSDMHDRFGSWYLAAAGYNTGENRVGRIMREVTGSERGDENSYFRIWPRLPRETRDYVPLMIAAARITKEPEKYGFDHVKMAEPPKVEIVNAAPATPLATIAKSAGTSVAEIRGLNPQLKLDRTRNDRHDTIRVPAR